MNKSLLAVMAIMPTLLVGCKSEELQDMAFEGVETITFENSSDIKTADLVTKPSINNLKFTYESEEKGWKSYVQVENKSSGEKGKYTFTFKSTAQYSGKDDGFRFIVRCGHINTYINLKWKSKF